MDRTITPDELPRWVPGQVLCSSEGLGWKGVSLRSYRYTGLDVEVPALSDFTVVAYQRGGTRMHRRFEGAWTRTHCLPGDVSLLTRQQGSHWRWTEDLDVSHVYLSESLVSGIASEVLERTVEEVRLHDLLKTTDPIITGIVDAIWREAGQRSIGGPLYVESLSTQLVVHLLRHYAAVSFRETSSRGRLSPAQCRGLRDHIEQRLHESLGLDELARVAGLGLWTFSRRFRESFGRTPHAYVIDRRVARAQRLLAEGRLALKEVASLCGFSDQAHLTRVLHERLGKTPAMLRRAVAVG